MSVKLLSMKINLFCRIFTLKAYQHRVNVNKMSSVLIGWSLRIDPLLQGVPELLCLDWLSQGAKGGLKLGDGRRQVVEPAACTRLFLQQPPAFS